MDEWIDYYDSTHTIYASKLHRDLHFKLIARDIIGYISSPDAVVLDYACGEALSAADVADACGKLYLAEPAPGVRGRLIARFAPNTKIRVRSLDDVRKMSREFARSRGHEFGRAIHDAGRTGCRVHRDPPGAETLRPARARRYPAPEVGMARDVLALLKFAATHGFLKDAFYGLASTALSDYRHLRTRVGLQRYSEDEMIEKLAAAGFTAKRAPRNIGHNRLADDVCRAARVLRRVRVNQCKHGSPLAGWAMIASARWRKRRRGSSALLFILVQIQAGPPTFAVAQLRPGKPIGEGCPPKFEGRRR